MLIKSHVFSLFSSFVCKCHSACVEGGQRTSYESEFSATSVWVLGMELTFSASAAAPLPAVSSLLPTSLYLFPLVLYVSWGKAKHASVGKFLNARYGNSLSHLVLGKPWLGTKWTGDAAQMVDAYLALDSIPAPPELRLVIPSSQEAEAGPSEVQRSTSVRARALWDPVSKGKTKLSVT